MKVAIIIVNYRTTPLVERALESIPLGYGATDDIRTIVVDGFSDDGSLPELKSIVQQPPFRDWVELLPLPMNGGFGWANNQAILRLLQGRNPPDLVHLLNPDAELLENAGTALIDRLTTDSNICAVGSQLVEPNGTCAASAFRFPTIVGEFGRGAATDAINRLLRIDGAPLPPSQTASQVDWVTGASVMLRADALKDAGLFDDSFFLYHEEVELMWRLRLKGWTVWHEPKSKVRHDGGAATGIRNELADNVLPPRPAYWYESQQLLFKRIYGRRACWFAALAWMTGHAIWRARCILGASGRHVPVRDELRGVLRSCVTIARDRSKRVTLWSDKPGLPPRWLERTK
jgi:GT2 family glycosyltransferase